MADVPLARIFRSHMVLPARRAAADLGMGRSGRTCDGAPGGKRSRDRCRRDGAWQVRLPALPAGGPHELIVTGNNTVKLDDMLTGEVWLCSGQSNMEWGVGMEPDGQGDHRCRRSPCHSDVRRPA